MGRGMEEEDDEHEDESLVTSSVRGGQLGDLPHKR
jgi:hypothetical protein